MNAIREADKEVYELVWDMIKKTHPRLADATVRVLFKEKLGTSHGMAQIGKPEVADAKMVFLASVDLIVWLDSGFWAMATPEQRLALVDHELTHFVMKTDSDGNEGYQLRHHDVEEFAEVIERRGMWQEELVRFGDALQPYLPGFGNAASQPDPQALAGRLAVSAEPVAAAFAP